MGQSAFPEKSIDSRSQTAELTPLGILVNILQIDPVLKFGNRFLGKVLCPIPRYSPRIGHETDSNCLLSIDLSESCHNFLEAASGGSACQL